MHTSSRTLRSLLLLTAVLAAGLVGSTAADAGAGRPSGPSQSVPAPDPRAAGPVPFTTRVYTGIEPCRILDTRQALGPLGTTPRTYAVAGNLAGQGGSNGCGIPPHATAIAVNLTGISTGGTGFVRGWGDGTEPNATLLNFSPALNASNQVDIPLCDGLSCPNTFLLKSSTPTHIVGDAVGYFTAPAWVYVRADGTAIRGSGLSTTATIARVSTGRYAVYFDRNVEACAPLTSSSAFATNSDVSAQIGTGGTVEVNIRNAGNTPIDEAFTLSMTC